MNKSIWTIVYKNSDGKYMSIVELSDKDMIERRKMLNNTNNTIIDVIISDVTE